jgi:hypothetical protein
MRSMLARASFALMAVLLLSVVVASTASALPEFKPVPTKRKITGTSGSVTFSWNVLGTKPESIECTKSKTTGEITGAQTLGNVVMTLTGCTGSSETFEGKKSGCPVHSEHGKEGEILVEHALSGALGLTKEAASGVGVLLKPESGKTWFRYEGNACLEYASLVWGTVAAEVSTVGRKQLTNTLSMTPSIANIRLDSGEEVKPWLQGIGSTTVSPKGTNELSFEEALEVT